MQVRWLNHPTQPQKNGTTEHVAREFAIVAEGYGQCERVKFKNYVERLRQAATAPKEVHAADNSVAPPTLKVGWSIVTRDGPGGQQYFVQEVRASGETFLYDGPPPSAPATIVARYQELAVGKVDAAVLQEQKRIAEAEKKNAELANAEKEKTAFHRIFGGR
jgi:hypothetical protein